MAVVDDQIKKYQEDPDAFGPTAIRSLLSTLIAIRVIDKQIEEAEMKEHRETVKALSAEIVALSEELERRSEDED